MSLATLESGQPRLFDAADPIAGLDRMLVRLWEELTSARSVACPICDAEMRPEHSVHARSRGGRCQGCGCTLT